MGLVSDKEYNHHEEEFILQKRRGILAASIALGGGVLSAGLLLKFCASLALVTAFCPPAAVVAVTMIAATVVVGALTFFAGKFLKSYKKRQDDCAEKAAQEANKIENNGYPDGTFPIGDVHLPPPTIGHKLVNNLYGSKPLSQRQPIPRTTFWKMLFSRCPTSSAGKHECDVLKP